MSVYEYTLVLFIIGSSVNEKYHGEISLKRLKIVTLRKKEW